MTTTDPRPTIEVAATTPPSSAGIDSRTAILPSASSAALSGLGTLNGHRLGDAHSTCAVEGQDSPQAKGSSMPKQAPPVGTQAGRSQSSSGTHAALAAAINLPGGHRCGDTQGHPAAGDQILVPAIPGPKPDGESPMRDQDPPAAKHSSPSIGSPLLADPLLALAADVLGDLEKVRIANENRLRQLTRSAEDSDGETRGFGLDEAHPDVARLAALVGMLADAEHKATLNLQRVMRKHPLGPWAKAQKGLGEKQVARLLASIGDPYIRPEITREDGTVESSRPRMVSELWAYCGYHVVPASHGRSDTHAGGAGGEQNGGDPGQRGDDTHETFARVAPKRQRGQHANWSATAKMRAFLIAESCIKQSGTPYRTVYDATRAKYAEAIHAAECVRCGPKSKPAQPGSPLSDGHKHARALRAVAKAVLKDLWREAKRIHETPVSGHRFFGTHPSSATDGPDIPADHFAPDTQTASVGREQAPQVKGAT